MKRITDRDFKYTPSYATDLRAKFRRMAAEQRKAEREQQARVATTNVAPLKSRSAK
jgi:hypothetical protein